MTLIQLLDVFVGLVEGIVPAKLREPMNALSEEIRSGVADLDGRVSRVEHDNQDLRYENSGLKDKVANAQDRLRSMPSLSGTDNIPANILRHLIDHGRVPKDDAFIQEAIVSYYRDTNNKIQCIKFLRQITGQGLKESKDQVDSWIGYNSNNPPY
jgi:FtsZ-binding cell division protein ZapB